MLTNPSLNIDELTAVVCVKGKLERPFPSDGDLWFNWCGRQPKQTQRVPSVGSLTFADSTVTATAHAAVVNGLVISYNQLQLIEKPRVDQCDASNQVSF